MHFPLSRVTRAFVLPVACAVALAAAPAARAQNFPTKPINVIVAFAAGGSVDAVTRLVTGHMSKTLGQPIVIENLGGAGGVVGSAKGARAAPDGYTLIGGSSGSHASSYSSYEKMPYAPDSFVNLGLTSLIPALVVVRKDLPVRNMQEFVAYAKANPGKVSFGHPGVGSTLHLQCELLKKVTGMDIQLVPYRGSSAAINDVMAGQIHGACDAPPSSLAAVASGHVRALAVMGPDRSPSMPDVPTTGEQNLRGLEAPAWTAMFAPKGTPRPVADALEKALSAALDDPEVQARIAQLGANVPVRNWRGAKFMETHVPAEIGKWAELAKLAKLDKQ